MSFKIPKIEYKNTTVAADTTSSDDILTNIADTSGIEIGMFARGTGIPTTAEVIAKTSNTVQLSVDATISDTAVDIDFGFKIEFQYPPKEPKDPALNPNANISESRSGLRQVSVNYIESVRSMAFSFLSPAIYAQMNTFLTTWACLGQQFRYYEDKTSMTYFDTELDSLKVEPMKQFPKGEDLYIHEVPLKIRTIV